MFRKILTVVFVIVSLFVPKNAPLNSKDAEISEADADNDMTKDYKDSSPTKKVSNVQISINDHISVN